MSNIHFWPLLYVFLSTAFLTGSENQHNETVPPEYFVNEIFEKYGNRDVLTYEGFEHLLENLGLGRLNFDQTHDVSIHKVNGTFMDIHDEKKLHYHSHEGEHLHERARRHLSHDHDNDNSDSTAGKSQKEDNCMSTHQILESYGMEPSHGLLISRAGFLHMCPAIVYELDQKHCWIHKDPKRPPTPQRIRIHVWLEASASILTMSAAGLLCAAIVPILNRSKGGQLLEFLVAVAAGTLIGDAFIHLLPQVLERQHAHDNAPLFRSTLILASMLFMYLIDTLLLALRKPKKAPRAGENEDMLEKSTGHHHSHEPQKTLACAVISGDVLHNITDGLSIGAAFSSSQGIGLACAIAVFCHELPHELGDYAVLLREGMSVKRALVFNLVSSVFSFIGMAAGIALGEILHAALWINAITAGSFIYIALVHLMPELKRSTDVQDILCQTLGLSSGITLMFFIGFYEKSFEEFLTGNSS